MAHIDGYTTKQTYVTRYTTDVDPRTLPEFVVRPTVSSAEGRHDGDAREGRQADMKIAHPSPQVHEVHRRAPLSFKDSPPPQNDAVAREGHGYWQSHSSLGADKYRRNETSMSTSSRATSPSFASSSTDTQCSHRLRKKYVTTTVTTITTTTILLPNMHGACIIPSTVASHQTQQRSDAAGSRNPAVIENYSDTYEDTQPLSQRPYKSNSEGGGGGYLERPHADGGSSVVPSTSQIVANDKSSRPWEYHQHTSNQVAMDSREELPTLQDLGITSYFDKGGLANGIAVPQRGDVPYATPTYHHSHSGAAPLRQQPWVSAETRYEVEGGKRHY